MLHLLTGLEFNTGLTLLLALIFVLIYEAINGFHDTANAVATVIYTRALCSQVAVAMSGVCNFLGVLMGGLSVAYAIVHLLPINLLLNISSIQGMAMMISLLLAAISWNLGTWYFGIPASSSHTLIGAIIGVASTNAWLTDNSLVQALNIPKLIEVFLSLIISPIVGLVLAGSIVFFIRRYFSGAKDSHNTYLDSSETLKKTKDTRPPYLTRLALIISSAGVSFSHGANDGQKGIGLIMLVLIGIVPAGFVVNMDASSYDIARTQDAVNNLKDYYIQHKYSVCSSFSSNKKSEIIPIVKSKSAKLNSKSILHSKTLDHNKITVKKNCSYYSLQDLVSINRASKLLTNIQNYNQLNAEERSYLRNLLINIGYLTDNIAKSPNTSKSDNIYLNNLRLDLLTTIEYAPLWIIIAVAAALSFGTTLGWRRVATTIGEKIGKHGMNYSQALSAQITAAISIGIASYTGMPVSTTHVLSSSVAGTMLVDGGGIQSRTIKNIVLAWIFTLPIVTILSGSLYWISLKIIELYTNCNHI